MEKPMNHNNIQQKKVAILCYYADFHGDVTDKIRDPRNLGTMASTRLQTAPSLTALNKIGYKDIAYSLHQANREDLSKLDGSHACFVGKLSADTAEKMSKMAKANLDAIHYLKSQNSKIVLTYCDHHIANQEVKILRDLYKELFKISDHIIYPTETLRDLSNKHIPQTTVTHVIKDPWHIREESQYLKRIEDEPWKIVWFGSNKNLLYLFRLLPKLLSSKILTDKYELTILGSRYSSAQASELIPRLRDVFNRWTFRLVPWNPSDQPGQLERELKRAHISLIPSDPTDPLKQGISHNRIVDALRSGCLPIASPLKSYQELAKISVLGNDFEHLLFLATKEYARLINKHSFYRPEYLAPFSPRNNIQNWTRFWESALANK